MRKQFDLKYYLEHPETKVVLRDGRNARILCTDLMNEDYPIAVEFIALTKEDEIETYTRDGKVIKNSSNDYSIDLFFDLPDPVEKRVPLSFVDLTERIKSGKTMWASCDSNTYAKLIIGFNSDCVSVVNGIRTNPRVTKFNYTELMGYNFIDGTPCWKEVRNERPY